MILLVKRRIWRSPQEIDRSAKSASVKALPRVKSSFLLCCLESLYFFVVVFLVIDMMFRSTIRDASLVWSLRSISQFLGFTVRKTWGLMWYSCIPHFVRKLGNVGPVVMPSCMV